MRLNKISEYLTESQAFSEIAIKRPISAAAAGTGNSSVFRHTLRVPKTDTFWRNAASGCESGSNVRKSAAEFERFPGARLRDRGV
jgi:hypothetical protein